MESFHCEPYRRDHFKGQDVSHHRKPLKSRPCLVDLKHLIIDVQAWAGQKGSEDQSIVWGRKGRKQKSGPSPYSFRSGSIWWH